MHVLNMNTQLLKNKVYFFLQCFYIKRSNLQNSLFKHDPIKNTVSISPLFGKNMCVCTHAHACMHGRRGGEGEVGK